jgi:hypothetical protein
MPSLSDAASFLLGAFVVSGVVWPYYPQARSILAKRDAASFSTTTSLVIIVSATLRCFFWLHQSFGTALLLQAVASILTQFAMVWVVLRVQQDGAEGGSGVSGAAVPVRRRREERSVLDLRPADFWRWTDFPSYVIFHAGFVVLMMLVSSLFRGSPFFAQLLGTASLGIEALLPVPTALNNARRKSTDGLSLVLIGSWAAGDAFKTLYAAANGEPVQFVLCGAFQLLVDVVICYQLVSFSSSSSPLFAAGGGGAGGALPFASASASSSSLSAGGSADGGVGGIGVSAASAPSSSASSSSESEAGATATASATTGEKRSSSLSRRGVTTL